MGMDKELDVEDGDLDTSCSDSEPDDNAEDGGAHDLDVKVETTTCLSTFEHEHDGARICAKLGYMLCPNNTLRNCAKELDIGTRCVTFEGRTLFARCCNHTGCSAMVNVCGEFDKARAWLLKWLISGDGKTKEHHLRQKEELKVLVQRERVRLRAEAKAKAKAAAKSVSSASKSKGPQCA